MQLKISEEELIRECKLGSVKYQEKLYKHFYGFAMGVGLRYLTSRDDAMEVVNDSFIKVFKAIRFYNDTQPFKAWLRRIVINTAIDLHRKNSKFLNNVDIEEAIYVGKTAEVIDNISAKDILLLLERLPEMQRTIFNLYEIDGYNHEEIGNMLNIPASTSRVFLSRAKEKLRKYVIQQQELNYAG